MTIHRVYVTTDAHRPLPVRRFLSSCWTLLKLLSWALGVLLLVPVDLFLAWRGLPPSRYTLRLIADRARDRDAHPAPAQSEELSGVVLSKEPSS
ncbi:MAG: hypothetical protein ABWX68_08260 [Arthrobacter sp.]|uniref:hypothetical protein n=1 Tax=Arthrobacter sp. TaxID=1667 RepID=UPI003481C6E3